MTDQTAEHTEQDEPVYEDIPDDNLPGYQAQVFAHTAEDVALAQQELANLDWQGYMEIIDYMHSLEAQFNLHEAGGFAWVEMVSPMGVRVTFGERAVDGVTALKRLRKSINYAIKDLKLISPGQRAEQITGNSQATSQTGAPPVPGGVPPVPGGAPVPQSAPPKPDYVPANPWRADYFKVLPQPENRVTIEFWGNNRKYADFMMINRPMSGVLSAFPQGWTEAHFQVANTYQMPVWVHWSESDKTNKAGKHYKNVDKVVPVNP